MGDRPRPQGLSSARPVASSNLVIALLGATDPQATLDAGAAAGLTAAEVEDRLRRGQGNVAPAAPSRTFPQILRANVLTPVNLLLGGLLVVVIIVAPIQDATFGLVIVFNSLVGSVQEVRA